MAPPTYAELAELAAEAVRDAVAANAMKYPIAVWHSQDLRMHALKAHRHLTTFLILDGHEPPDGEEHLKIAISRAAMALSNYRAEK